MIRTRKYVDRAGNVSWHMSNGGPNHVLRFTANQYRDDRVTIARAIIRTRNQLKVVQPAQRLTEAEVLKEFGR